MATVIKATDRNRGVQYASFNFEDMRRRAEVLLEQTRKDAAKLILAAKQEADQIRKQAETTGLQQGLAAAKQQMDQQVQQLATQQTSQQVATLMPAITQVTEQLQLARETCLAHWEHNIIQLATAIAGRVIRHTLQDHPEITLNLVREALEMAAGSPRVILRLHPADHATLAPHLTPLLANFQKLGHAEVVADETLTPGGCRVETELGTIDQQIDVQLKRIEEELVSG